MAWLDRDPANDDVKRSEFVGWVEQYLLPHYPGIPCAGLDLYAARCAVLHSYSAESRLSRQGKARPIWYAWGNRTASELQAAADAAGHQVTALHVETLATATWKGVDDFMDEVGLETEHGRLVIDRLKKWLSDIRP